MQNEWWKVNSWLMFACGVWHYKLLFSDDLCKSSDPLLTLTYKPIPSLSPLLTSPLAEFFYRDRNISSRLDCQSQQPIPSLRDSNPSPLSLSQPGHTGNRFNEPTYGLFGLNQIYVSDANWFLAITSVWLLWQAGDWDVAADTTEEGF